MKAAIVLPQLELPVLLCSTGTSAREAEDPVSASSQSSQRICPSDSDSDSILGYVCDTVISPSSCILGASILYLVSH